MSFSSAMPFSRPRVLTASTISADMFSVSHEVRTMDVGVGDRDDAGVGGDGDRIIGGVQQFAGEGLAALVCTAGADLRAAADVAAEVLGLGERALDPRRGDLQRVLLPHVRKVMGHALTEVERDALWVIDEEADEVAPDDLREQDLDFRLHLG